ncbi:MAG: ABC transporter ATP-binding protein [Planctomycetes bacterium]|nr:ABC transporter ATP-binding protein [Planctomycetota bacterium]
MRDRAERTVSACEPAVEVEDLTKRYGDRVALGGVSFAVERGEFFGLLGPNGGGKSTLFRILSTASLPDSGSARVLGTDVATSAAKVRPRIGVVFQSPSLDRKLTVAENLRHQGHLYGLCGRELAGRIESSLARFGLADRAKDRVETLSGGLARRVEVAKGLLHRPEVLLLDEPSTGLDPGSRADLAAQLAEIRGKDGVTVLLTTHLLEEADGCDRLALLDRGRLVACGSPAALKGEFAGEIVSIETKDTEEVRGLVAERFGLAARISPPFSVRLEHPRAHEIVPRLVEALGARIESITVGRPTLGDVYLARTGRRFAPEEAQ